MTNERNLVNILRNKIILNKKLCLLNFYLQLFLIKIYLLMENENNIENIRSIEDSNVEMEEVTEGKATVRLANEDKSFSAFYNPAQVYYQIK
jgi:hypothetical protein